MTCPGCGQVNTPAIAEDWWRRHSDAVAADERLAEAVWQFRGGEHQATVRWLQALGCNLVSTDGSPETTIQYTLDGLTGVRTALLYPSEEPIGLAVCFGLLMAGMFWPQVYPKTLELVKARWTAERKSAKKAAA